MTAAAIGSLEESTGVVTGASGFLGRAVLRRLPPGCVVHATYHADVHFPAWADSCAAEVRPVRVDLARERLHQHVPPVDWALLLAARVATAASWEDPIGELQAVAGVTVNSVAGLRTDRLVYLSSGSVYETLTGELGPGRVLTPRLPYSVAKLSAELLLASYAEAPYWAVRFFGAFGPGEPAFKLARRLVEAFVRGDRTFELAGDGTNHIDPMYIDEAAQRLSALVVMPGESRPVDLAQGEHPTLREFVETAYSVAHPSPEGAPLELRCTGDPHEAIRGWARSDPAIWDPSVEHLSIAEGFQRYAAEMSRR